MDQVFFLPIINASSLRGSNIEQRKTRSYAGIVVIECNDYVTRFGLQLCKMLIESSTGMFCLPRPF